MALSEDETATINRLSRRHDAEILELELYDRYYEGTQPLSYMHPEILREVADRIRPVIVFWPQMVVDSVEERLRLEGFKTGDQDLDDELGRVWAANDMVLGFRQAVLDALVMRRSYVCVGSNEEDRDTPLVTPESPLEVYGETDPRTRRMVNALRRTADIDQTGRVAARYATLYQPNQTIWLQWRGAWLETGRDVHNLGRVPVVPVVNRPRTRSTVRTPRNQMVERIGRSDLDPVIPLSDAACKMATDLMVAGEFVAVPLRGIFGIGPDDLVDTNGNKLTVMQAIMGRLFTIDDTEAKGYEFAAAQLANFTTALTGLAHLVASVSGLPPHYLGQSGDNPASAEAIAGSEARLCTRAERKQDSFGCAAGQVARLIRRIQTGEWDKTLDTVRIDWRDVRTPTLAAKADAAVKLFTTNPKPIVPLRQTRESLGYTDVEIEAMEEEDDRAAQSDPLATIARGQMMPPTPQPAGDGSGYAG